MHYLNYLSAFLSVCPESKLGQERSTFTARALVSGVKVVSKAPFLTPFCATPKSFFCNTTREALANSPDPNGDMKMDWKWFPVKVRVTMLVPDPN